MARNTPLPCFNLLSFFHSTDGELAVALAHAIAEYAERRPTEKLNANQEAVRAWGRMQTDVPNGGFTQFFYNHRGDDGVEPLADLLDAFAMPKAATVVRDAVTVYQRHRAKFPVANPWDGLFGGIGEFNNLDRAFMKVLSRCTKAIAQ